MRRWIVIAAIGAVLAGAIASLHDPPWAGGITSGMRAWEEDSQGTRFRWTTGRASFFIPADARTLTLPLKAVFPGKNSRPTVVAFSVDGRWLADVELPDPTQWVRTPLPLPRRETARRFRRVDLHVNRTAVGAFILGVMTGEASLEF